MVGRELRREAEAAAKLALHEALEDAGIVTGPGGVRSLVGVVLDAIQPVVSDAYRERANAADSRASSEARRRVRDSVQMMQKDRNLSREERNAAKLILPILLDNPRYDS